MITIEEKHWRNGSFTVGFSFSNGIAHCEGFSMETVVSNALKLKYRILVMNPADKNFWTMKGMEEAKRQFEINEVIEKQHRGHLVGKEFVFEVYDSTGKRKLFVTKFDAAEKIPAEGYGSEHLVVTSFTWTYLLPPDLQKLAREALQSYMER